MSWCRKSSLQRPWWGLGGLVLVSFTLAGCPVDERTLSPGTGNHGGTTNGGSSSGTGNRSGQSGTGDTGNGGAEPMGDGGMNSSAGEDSGAGKGGSGSGSGGSSGGGGSNGSGGSNGAGGCGDLDQDGVQDCEQTLAQNSRFMTDTADWQAEPTLKQSWDQRNARSDETSGALKVRNENVGEGEGWMLSGSRQCLAAEGGKGYLLAASTFIPGGQGAGSAGVAVWFFGSDDCAANSIGNITLQLVSGTDTWLPAQGTVQAPGGTRSMHVRLVTSKPFAQPSLEALFDDVLVREE